MTDLKDEQAEEVGIGQPLELLEKVKWQEVEDVVLGGLDGIVLRRDQRLSGHGHKTVHLKACAKWVTQWLSCM